MSIPKFDKSIEDRLKQNKWIKVKLKGLSSNRNGIGSRIAVAIPGLTQIQEVICGDSYSSQSSLTLSYGLKNADFVENITLNCSLVKIYLHNVFNTALHFLLLFG